MHRLAAATFVLCLLTIAPAIFASQSGFNVPSRRDGIRLKVQVRNTTLPATVRLRFLTEADSLSGVGRVVSVPYDETVAVEQLRLRVEPTDPAASVMVTVERWHDGALQQDGSMTGKGVLVQVRGDFLGLTAWSVWPAAVHRF
jgi:hypothetical protein